MRIIGIKTLLSFLKEELLKSMTGGTILEYSKSITGNTLTLRATCEEQIGIEVPIETSDFHEGER